MLSAKRAAIFDLDGTLVDSLPDLTVAVNRILAEEGRQPVTRDDIKPMVGDGVAMLLRRAFDARGGAPAKGEADALARFVSFYENNAAVLTQPFPHVVETLERLKAASIPMAVCTNKPGAATREILRTLKLDRFFAVVVGGDESPAMKPNAVHVDTARQRLAVPREAAVMVGDSINDVLSAKGAGVTAIAVTYGYSRKPATELGADLVITDFQQVADAMLGRD